MTLKKRPFFLAVLLTTAAFTSAQRSQAHEILPAATAIDDLKAFDRSIVLPSKEETSRREPISQALSHEAKSVKAEGQQSRSALLQPGGRGRHGGPGGGSGDSPSESSPASAVRNSGKSPDAASGSGTPGGPRQPRHSGKGPGN